MVAGVIGLDATPAETLTKRFCHREIEEDTLATEEGKADLRAMVGKVLMESAMSRFQHFRRTAGLGLLVVVSVLLVLSGFLLLAGWHGARYFATDRTMRTPVIDAVVVETASSERILLLPMRVPKEGGPEPGECPATCLTVQKDASCSGLCVLDTQSVRFQLVGVQWLDFLVRAEHTWGSLCSLEDVVGMPGSNIVRNGRERLLGAVGSHLATSRGAKHIWAYLKANARQVKDGSRAQDVPVVAAFEVGSTTPGAEPATTTIAVEPCTGGTVETVGGHRLVIVTREDVRVLVDGKLAFTLRAFARASVTRHCSVEEYSE